MRKNISLGLIVSGIALCIIPALIFSEQTNMPYGGADLYKEADKISQILFGPVAKIVAVFGGGVAMIAAFVQQAYSAMFTFGAVTLAAVGLPSFIKGFFSLLLP